MGVDVLTVSSKGQIVLPAAIRKALSIASGDKLAAYAADGAILLKPISLPAENDLKTWLDTMRDWAEQVDMRESEVSDAIAEIRAERRA